MLPVEDGGELSSPDFEPTRGEWPPHFAVGPGGETFFAENRESDAIVPFSVGAGGEGSAWSTEESVTEPICTEFADPA